MIHDKIMTIKEVADYLNIHVTTIYRAVRENQLPAFKVGGRWRCKKAILDKWVESQVNSNNKKSNM